VRVVADTNLYISALVFGGKPQALLDLAQDGAIELLMSDAIVAEALRVLQEKFERTPEQLSLDAIAIEAVTTRVHPIERVSAVKDDPSDDKILECAVAADAAVIISGDHHLLSLGSFRAIRIQRVSEFLAEFSARSR
jgi:uncharacterized protein